MERLYWNNDWKFAETWEEAMKEAVYPEKRWRMCGCRIPAKSFRIITLMSMRIRCCVDMQTFYGAGSVAGEKCGTDL